MADRIIEEKEWQDGDSMSSTVKEKYKKIVRSRFRTWDGLCFMTAGFFLLAGISPYFIAKGIEFLTGAVTAAWCLVILFVVISLFIKELDITLERFFGGYCDNLNGVAPMFVKLVQGFKLIFHQ